MVYILNLLDTDLCVEFPGGSVAKEFTCNAGDVGLIPGLGRSPGEGNGNPLQYSCLGKQEEPAGLQSMGLQESDTTELNHHHHHRDICNYIYIIYYNLYNLKFLFPLYIFLLQKLVM